MRAILQILISLISILPIHVFGQDYTEIQIAYGKGFYPFDKIGRYDYKEKILIKPLDSNTYKVDNYIITKKYQTIFKNTREKTSNRKGFIIDSDLINGLIVSLSNDSNIIDSKSFDSEKYLTNIRLKDLRRIARYEDIAWNFRKSYTDSAELNYYVRDIKTSARLDSFLIDYQAKNRTDMMTIDAYHYLEIKYITPNDTVIYNSNLFDKNFWGLPFIDIDNVELDINLNVVNCTFDLDINKYLLRILDKKSEAREMFRIESFLNYYIAWYVDRAYDYKFYKKDE